MQSLFNWPQSPGEVDQDALVEVLGVPGDAGNSASSGSRYGPDAIRRASGNVARPLLSGFDHGDIADVCGFDWMDVLNRTSKSVEAIARKGSTSILLGGDHSISWAGVKGVECLGPITLIWIDAHTDFCAWQETEWHNHKQVLRRVAALDHVREIVHIGHRGITYADESAYTEKMRLFSPHDIQESGAKPVLEAISQDSAIYISLDIDGVDPRWAPGTGHPVPGGLQPDGLAEILGALGKTRRAAALDVMEVNPMLDPENRTSDVAASMIADFLHGVAGA